MGDRTAYVLANLSDNTQEIKIRLENKEEQVFKRSAYVLDEEQKYDGMKPADGWLSVSLNPWELTIIEPIK